MTDVASQRQEESGYREVKDEAEGMEVGARVKLIQCKMNKMKESTLKKPTDPPQSNRLQKTLKTKTVGKRNRNTSTCPSVKCQ